MFRSESIPAVQDPLEPLIGLAHLLAEQTIELACGLALGAAGARVLRARGVHWSWAALLVGAVLMLRSFEGPWTTVALAASVGALLRSRRWHREDLDAGLDLARDARLRRGPLDTLRLSLELIRARRIRAHGPMGWFRGEELILGRAPEGWAVSIPFGGTRGGTHALLVGATGSGKTMTQAWIAARAIDGGMGAVVVDPKGDSTIRTAVANAARRAGREFIEWTPEGPSAYNPFGRGTDSEVADKVLAGEHFTEPHYLRQAQRFLGHAVRALRASGTETSLRTIAESLDPLALELLARRLPGASGSVTQAYLDSLTSRQLSDVAGARDRLSILAESDVASWLEPSGAGVRGFDLFEAVRMRAVVYFDLDADRRPLLTQMLGAAIVQDLQTTVASLQSQPIPTVVVIDEFAALAAEQVVRLFGRARSAGFSLVLGTQELADLRLPGRDRLLEQVLGNLSVVLAHRQIVPASAELLCQLAGTRGAWRTSLQDGGRKSRTRAREAVLAVDEVMNLAPGWAAAIAFGQQASSQIVRVFSEREEVSR
jgi:TraM recognition site of TraD and TraG/Type IV secretion-system coupling protein DNA-binding domain